MTDANTQPKQNPHDWSKDALLAKAQKYSEEMMSHSSDEWQRVLWSSLTLELLARCLSSQKSFTSCGYKKLGQLVLRTRFRT